MNFLDQLSAFLEAYWPILVPVVIGAVSIYLLLPQARRLGPLWAALLSGSTIILAGILLVHAEMVLPEAILFYAFAGIAVASGGLMIAQRNPVRVALSFALVVLSSCGLFLLQGAPFLMASTIIVYAGAIVVTFLFVIMLAQQAGLTAADQHAREPFLGTLAGFVLLAALLCVLQRNYGTSQLDDYLNRAQQAAQAKSFDEAKRALGDITYFQEFEDLVPNPGGLVAKQADRADRLKLIDALGDAEQHFTRKDLEKLQKALALVYETGLRVRFRHGSLHADSRLPLSPFSGTPANSPVPDPNKKKERLPAANVASLGRSLFTDYLLPVELAGVLLLVASIGAIVIAGRRSEVLK